MTKSKRIKNKLYTEFLEKGSITPFTENDVDRIISNIEKKETKNKEQAISLVALLYTTGARPCEVLKIRGKDITKERNHIVVQTEGAKNGLNRPIRIPYKLNMVKRLYKYVTSIHPDMYLFFNFQSKYKRLYKKKNGEIVEYKQNSNNLRYYFNKWTNGEITPYFFRHNRFSKLVMKGISANEIMLMKGAKSMDSVRPYLHMSKEISKKIANKID